MNQFIADKVMIRWVYLMCAIMILFFKILIQRCFLIWEREEERDRGREPSMWERNTPTPTGDWTCNFWYIGQCSSQLSHPARAEWFFISKPIPVIYHINRWTKIHVIISVNIEITRWSSVLFHDSKFFKKLLRSREEDGEVTQVKWKEAPVLFQVLKVRRLFMMKFTFYKTTFITITKPRAQVLSLINRDQVPMSPADLGPVAKWS